MIMEINCPISTMKIKTEPKEENEEGDNWISISNITVASSLVKLEPEPEPDTSDNIEAVPDDGINLQIVQLRSICDNNNQEEELEGEVATESVSTLIAAGCIKDEPRDSLIDSDALQEEPGYSCDDYAGFFWTVFNI